MREATHLPFRAGYNWVLTAMVGALKKPVGSTSCGCAAIFMRNRAVDLVQGSRMNQDIVFE